MNMASVGERGEGGLELFDAEQGDFLQKFRLVCGWRQRHRAPLYSFKVSPAGYSHLMWGEGHLRVRVRHRLDATMARRIAAELKEGRRHFALVQDGERAAVYALDEVHPEEGGWVVYVPGHPVLRNQHCHSPLDLENSNA